MYQHEKLSYKNILENMENTNITEKSPNQSTKNDDHITISKNCIKSQINDMLVNKLLSGVKAYVALESINESEIVSIKGLLESMGAELVDNLNDTVTHAIFNVSIKQILIRCINISVELE